MRPDAPTFYNQLYAFKLGYKFTDSVVVITRVSLVFELNGFAKVAGGTLYVSSTCARAAPAAAAPVRDRDASLYCERNRLAVEL